MSQAEGGSKHNNAALHGSAQSVPGKNNLNRLVSQVRNATASRNRELRHHEKTVHGICVRSIRSARPCPVPLLASLDNVVKLFWPIMQCTEFEPRQEKKCSALRSVSQSLAIA
jgi:hypothetical protein